METITVIVSISGDDCKEYKGIKVRLNMEITSSGRWKVNREDRTIHDIEGTGLSPFEAVSDWIGRNISGLVDNKGSCTIPFPTCIERMTLEEIQNLRRFIDDYLLTFNSPNIK